MAFDITYAIVSFIVVLAAYVSLNHYKKRRFWELLDQFEGLKTLPFIGNIHQFGTNPESFLQGYMTTFQKLNYKTFKLFIGSVPIVVLCDPPSVEVLLSNNKEITKSEEYHFFYDWLGNGLLTSTGNKWRKQRKVLTPAFHFKILEKFLSIFNSKGDILIEKMANHKGQLFPVNKLITLYTLDVLCETAMGVDVNVQNDSESDYVKAVYSECKLTMIRAFSPLKRIEYLYKLTGDYLKHKANVNTLHTMTNDVIKSRRIQMKEQIEKVMNTNDTTLDIDDVYFGKQKVAFLDILLLSKTPDGKPLSDQVIREETDTFMFEGHDTTSSCISFALYALANNAEVQRKVFEEVRDIIGDDPSIPVSHQDLQSMKYLEMVIRETLRMYPSVPVIGRKLDGDIVLPDGRIIPGGCYVFVHPYLVGRNPNVYEDPENFDPERFNAENIQQRHPFAFVAFSAGPRNCIGQKFAMVEIKSILSKILRNYELLPGGPGSELRLSMEVILKSCSGHQIRIVDRVYK